MLNAIVTILLIIILSPVIVCAGFILLGLAIGLFITAAVSLVLIIDFIFDKIEGVLKI